MKVALIGLGNMGLPMATNLLKAGHQVIGFDLNEAVLAAHRANGGETAPTIAQAVADVDAVVTMLPTGKHVADVCTGQGGILASISPRTKLIIDSSTIDVATAKSVGADAAEKGIEFLDAPVSGGTAGAAAGTLTFMVGGTEAGFAAAEPLLRGMGRAIIHAGPAGSGQVAKACNNMMLAINMIGVSEAFALAERLGLSRQKMFDIVAPSTGQSFALTGYCPVPGPVPTTPANRDYTPGFATKLMVKDLRLAQEAAEAGGAPTPLGAHTTRIFEAMLEDGHGDRDFSIIAQWLGAKFRSDLV
ncbi:MAG: 3-hydroxyisobutyrate dehydrogenase [Alphaproteobacteria bacterium]|nr:3-hydroxyisobutyrate dehydrogenase [Alphaproteobacteria bacterium]